MMIDESQRGRLSAKPGRPVVLSMEPPLASRQVDTPAQVAKEMLS